MFQKLCTVMVMALALVWMGFIGAPARPGWFGIAPALAARDSERNPSHLTEQLHAGDRHVEGTIKNIDMSHNAFTDATLVVTTAEGVDVVFKAPKPLLHGLSAGERVTVTTDKDKILSIDKVMMP